MTEAVEKNHDVSLRIDEAQENSIPFEEMGVSKWAKVRSVTDSINWLRTLRRSLRGHEKTEKAARSGLGLGHKRGRAAGCAFGPRVSVKCECYIRSLGFAGILFCR